MRAERGAVLLEVLVALVILGTAGAAIAGIVRESDLAIGRVRLADEETRAASAFLGAVSLWPRDDLDRHLGQRREGPWLLAIARPSPVLYAVALTDTTGSALLRTTLYRPEARHAGP